MIAFIDLETTGLLKPIGTKPYLQPRVIEIYAIKTCKKSKPVSVIETVVNPEMKIPYFITKLTGIQQWDANKGPTFRDIASEINDFFKGVKTFVAHNAPFDYGVLIHEGKRNNVKLDLPKDIFCTVEQSLHIHGRRLNLERLYFLATGRFKIEGYHGAKNDVIALIECYEWLNKTTWKEQQKAAKRLPEFEEFHNSQK